MAAHHIILGVAALALLGCASSDAGKATQSSGQAIEASGGARDANAPPEGVAPGGLDFGKWRNTDPTAYSASFQSRVQAWAANKDLAALRAGLTENGFTCREGSLVNRALECRIEIMERQCGIDWFVVVPRIGADPVAGHDVMCLGALPTPVAKPKK